MTMIIEFRDVRPWSGEFGDRMVEHERNFIHHSSEDSAQGLVVIINRRQPFSRSTRGTVV